MTLDIFRNTKYTFPLSTDRERLLCQPVQRVDCGHYRRPTEVTRSQLLHQLVERVFFSSPLAGHQTTASGNEEAQCYFGAQSLTGWVEVMGRPRCKRAERQVFIVPPEPAQISRAGMGVGTHSPHSKFTTRLELSMTVTGELLVVDHEQYGEVFVRPRAVAGKKVPQIIGGVGDTVRWWTDEYIPEISNIDVRKLCAASGDSAANEFLAWLTEMQARLK